MKIYVKIVSEKTPEYLVHTKKQWRRKREGNLDGGGLLSEGLRYFIWKYTCICIYIFVCVCICFCGGTFNQLLHPPVCRAYLPINFSQGNTPLFVFVLLVDLINFYFLRLNLTIFYRATPLFVFATVDLINSC